MCIFCQIEGGVKCTNASYSSSRVGQNSIRKFSIWNAFKVEWCSRYSLLYCLIMPFNSTFAVWIQFRYKKGHKIALCSSSSNSGWLLRVKGNFRGYNNAIHCNIFTEISIPSLLGLYLRYTMLPFLVRTAISWFYTGELDRKRSF